MKKLMVIDGNSIVNRAFYGVSQNLTTRAGQPTNAIFGFLNILTKLLDEGKPDALCVTFDRKAPTFRHLAYEGYKATRKGMPDELASQMPILKDVLSAMNIPMYELDGWEADDLLGTIARKDAAAGWETAIVTGDKDSLQLVTEDTTVKLVSTRMGRTTTRDMTPEAFREEYGFDPIHIIDLKALMGDTSDNIPGVKGVGEKTAMALIQRYGSIDDLYAALPEVEMAPGVPAKPNVVKKLTEGEEMLLRTLSASFRHSDLLHKHVRFLYSHGGIYKCYNSNLLYHGCIPMEKDGSFASIMVDGKTYCGKNLMDYFDKQVQNAYFMPEGAPGKEDAVDLMWYLWCGAKSPVFGKDKITTFEHYFVEDKSTHKETMNPYYQLSQKEEFCRRILQEFGLPEEGSHIINGHVPVKMKDGEKPVKAGGKLFIIDGGLSKAYQSTTGIAGYTLIYNSHHLALAEHMPYDPRKENTPKVSVVEKMTSRVMVADTDKGRELKEQIEDLKELVAAYREGTIKERIE